MGTSDREQKSAFQAYTLQGYQKTFVNMVSGPISVSLISWEGYPTEEPASGFPRGQEGIIYCNNARIWTGYVYRTASLINTNSVTNIRILLPGNKTMSAPLPLGLFQADVLPGMEEKDPIRFMPVLAAKDLEILASGEGICEPGVCADQETAKYPEIIAEGEIIAAETPDSFFGGHDSGMVLVRLKTSCGILPVLATRSDRGWSPEPGAFARCRGRLLGNAACGIYSGGAIYDFYSDFRVLAGCFACCEFDRAYRLFAEECAYYCRGELRATGAAGIVEALNRVRDQIRAKGTSYHISFAQIDHADRPMDAPYQNGQKALGFIDSHDRLAFLICIDVNDAGKISRLYTIYDFEEGAYSRMTDSFREWKEWHD